MRLFARFRSPPTIYGAIASSVLAAGCATTATPSVPAVPAASPTAVAPEPNPWKRG